MAMLAGRPADHPYSSDLALQNSCYTRWTDGMLRYAAADPAAEGSPPALAERVHSALRALILDPDFPCVGARSALNQASYRFALYDELGTEAATAGLARDLFTFVQEQPSIGGEYSTFLATFDHPKTLTPLDFERLLWAQLEALHALDGSAWDASVSADPAEP
ncbi:MAG: YqcI/YcgG family protein, partial [Dehalococcoidia bacterium]